MPEGGILLDLTSCRDWGMVQDAIRRAFGFPAHYGENWDAMWDCLTDLFWVTDDRHIVVRGLDALPPGEVFDLVLNATSASLGGDTPQVPAQAFARDNHHVAGLLRQVSVPGAGHFPQEENPAGFQAALRPFLDRFASPTVTM